MKAYLITTGTIFGLITLAHVWRMFVEPRVATEPDFVVLTVIAAALSVWGWSLLKRSPRK